MSKFTRILELKKKVKTTSLALPLASFFQSRLARMMLLVGLFLLGFLYLWFTTTTAQRGFTLDTLRKQQQELKRNNIRLDREMVQYESMPYLKALAEKHNLQSGGQIQFITGSGSVALQR